MNADGEQELVRSVPGQERHKQVLNDIQSNVSQLLTNYSHNMLFNRVPDIKQSTYPFSCGCDHKCIWHQKGSFCLLYKRDRENWDSNLWQQQQQLLC